MNKNNIIVYDLETGGRDPFSSQIIQIGAVALEPRKITPIKGGIFDSLVKPVEDEKELERLSLEPLQEEALKVNKKEWKDLRKAPTAKTVFKKFDEWIQQYSTESSMWGRPVRAGYNINGFDDLFLDRYCNMGYGPTNNGRQGFFHPIHHIDMMSIIHFWFENQYIPELRSLSMDSLREYFGLKTENAHDALQDVKDTAELLHRFSRLNRQILEQGVAFKGSCKKRLLEWN